MDAILKRIEEKLEPKEETMIIVTSDKTEFTNRFAHPIFLNPRKKYKMALMRLETYNSIPNVTQSNNEFVYTVASSQTKTITLSVGSYEIKQINGEIQRQLEQNGDWDATNKQHFIEVGANTATLRCFIKITNCSVDIGASSIRSILGFSQFNSNGDSNVLTSGYHESDGMVDIMPVNSIMVNCDIIGGSYVNETEKPVIYSFYPNVSPGYKIVEIPRKLVYLPVIATERIPNVRIWLTDQNGKLIDLRGEKLTINFHLISSI
jgi:hypothetical protein